MSGMKIESLAKTIGIDPEQLVKQLQEAGVPIKVSTDEITEAQKQTLLAFLQQRHGKTETNPTAAPRKMTLKRKSTSEIKVAGTARLAGSKSVNVEVRKKRTYIKRTPAEAAAEEATARKTKLAAEAAAELEASRQEREMNARKQERIDADKRKEAADVAAEEAMKVAAKAEAEAVEAEAAAEEAAEVEAAAQVKAEAEKAEAASKVEKIAKPDETKADKTKADKTKADKTKADKTKADKTKADKTKADKTEADKTEEKPVEVAPEPVVAAPVVPERTTAQKLADADAKRRAANKARVEAEKALIERRRLRAEEEALEKERKEARKKEEAEAKALEAKQKAAATKTDKDKPEKKKFNNPAAAKTDNNRRGGRKKGSKYDREELHVSKGRGGRNKKRGGKIVIESDNEHGFSLPTEAVVHTVEVPDTISVGELAQRMSVKSVEVIKSLMGLGTMATINQILDQDTATIVIEEMGHIAKPVVEDALEVELENISEGQMGEAVKRAPVVTVMGHVDHGKTSLLDYIRSAKVTAGEAGGITQHIGAYKVILDEGEITFLDTPGHAAFTEMRTRGANATDIVIIVVAADDGVMPQTIEAVKLAKAANATIIVAVNKMDKEQANPDRVKQELSNYDVIPEDWGGDVPFVPLSALTGQGVDDLLEIINLQAEVLEFKAPVVGPASGVVIESRLDKGRGTIVTVLVQSGTLNRGDVLVVGQEFGRVRAMFNEHGEAMQTATPSTPVEVLGLSGTPSAGDSLQVAPDERKAREIANARVVKAREIKIGKQQAAKLDEMFNKMESGDVQTLNVVVKADVHGSAEAVQQALTNLSTDLVRVRVVSTGVGGINETDAQLAVSSDAILIGFNVRADNAARRVITERGLDVQYFSIIYDLIDVVTTAMTGMLAPVYKDEIIGLAQVNEVFSSPKFGDIAGSIVLEGKIKRSNPIRVLRDNVVIYEGELESLRRFKDDVKEVASGVECGIGVKDYKDVQAGDQIEVYERVLMTPKL